MTTELKNTHRILSVHGWVVRRTKKGRRKFWGLVCGKRGIERFLGKVLDAVTKVDHVFVCSVFRSSSNDNSLNWPSLYSNYFVKISRYWVGRFMFYHSLCCSMLLGGFTGNGMERWKPCRSAAEAGRPKRRASWCQRMTRSIAVELS